MTIALTKTTAELQFGVSPCQKSQIIEVSVFLFLIVPSLVLSLFAVRQGDLSFVLTATATIFRDLALVCLIVFFLWHNGESVALIGWTWHRSARDLILGVILFLPFGAGAALLEKLLLSAGLSAPSTALPKSLEAEGKVEMILGAILVTVVAIAEETIFRGYLLLRFRAILGSTTAAVVLSSVIFAVGHGYEGSAGLVTVGFMGGVFALVYLWRGSLIAPIVMHFLQDFLGIILIPLLGLK